jgi:putative transposase
VILTYKYRLKDSSNSWLNKSAKSVNFVWNFCNEVSFDAIKNRSKFLSGFDLNNLTSGSSKDLNLNSQTIQAVGEEFALKRKQTKKFKLKWRTKKSLGWIPFKSASIKISNNTITYNKHTVSFWNSRPIEGKMNSGSFSQDVRGRWYINLTCEVENLSKSPEISVGIDLGLKDIATLSDGKKYTSNKYTKNYANKLGKFQRANKKKQTRNLHAKIKNSRLDQNHKISSEISKSYNKIFVGDLNSSKLIKTKLAKSVTDNGLSQFKNLLKYKVIRRSGEYFEVSEYLTTQTCSNCLEIGGPKGQKGLSVREWVCGKCNCHHDRDINSAINILRIGHNTLTLK